MITVKDHYGERLYIHPVAVDTSWGRSKNKIQYLITPEFKLDQDGELEFQWQLWSNRTGHSEKWRIFWQILYFIKTFSFLRWEQVYAVPCVSIFQGGNISVEGQLYVEDPDGLTETCYLVPSQDYLKKRIEEWLSLGMKEWDLPTKQTFLKWKKEHEGYEILYFSSLDT